MIPIFEPSLTLLERKYLTQAFDEGWISSQGEFIKSFEEKFALYHDLPFGVATSNCTTALHLALLSLGIGFGDEVLCPDLTFIAPANMIKITGAVPVLVDVEEKSICIDPKKIEEKINPKTKAIIVVHAFGHAADMDPIIEIAKKYRLKIIEDVAEAPGALYKGQLVGTFGDLACYSFFANKIITTGEGGMILTKDKNIDKSLRILRDHGMSREKKYVHDVVGFNYRMTNMQAAIGLAQLERLPVILAERKKQENIYIDFFSNSPFLKTREVENWCESVHWLTTITLKNHLNRDLLIEHLKAIGIDSRQMVYPVHMAKPYVSENTREDLRVSKRVSLASLHLPSSTYLNDEAIKKVCDSVTDWLSIHGLN
jgi:perosamine synthetase